MLTSKEHEFLEGLGYSVDDLFDARGMSNAYWKKAVRVAGKVLVLGAECRTGGHRLRTRSGHCVQCDPSKLAYQNRYNSEGYVYIAGSLSARVIKFGVARWPRQREDNLNGHQYGGISDWKVLFHVRHPEAGKLERSLFNKLSRYQVVIEFMKDGAFVDASEILSCTFSEAYSAMTFVVGEHSMSEGWRHSRALDYDFGRRKRTK
jgi:hypothetical protein